jgi:hypothetical protein
MIETNTICQDRLGTNVTSTKERVKETETKKETKSACFVSFRFVSFRFVSFANTGMVGSAVMAATQPYCDSATQFLCVGLVSQNGLFEPFVAYI